MTKGYHAEEKLLLPMFRTNLPLDRRPIASLHTAIILMSSAILVAHYRVFALTAITFESFGTVMTCPSEFMAGHLLSLQLTASFQ